jgi:cell division protein FtsL
MKVRPMTLWTVAVIAASLAFIAHLSLRFETVGLGYDVGRARTAQRRLVEERRLLSIEAATLRDVARVETIARGALGMEVPEPERVVPVGSGTSGGRRRTSGRMR